MDLRAEQTNRSEDTETLAPASSISSLELEIARPELPLIRFWLFSIGGPIGAVSILLFYFTWPPPKYLPHSGNRSWRELDYIGSILLIAASVLVVFPFQNAAVLGGQWSKPVFIAPLIFGIILWLGLFTWSIFVDWRLNDIIDAALPMRLLRDRIYAAAVLNTLFLGFPYMLVIYAFPLRLQVVNDKSALIAGVMLLPMLGSSAVGSLLAGAINGKKDRIFETFFVATSLVVLGCGLLSTLSSSPELEKKALGFLVFVGLGFGMVVSTATMVATFHSSIRDHAPAQGLMAQVRVLGGSIGIAASSAILGVKLQAQRGPSHPDETPLLASGNSTLLQGELEATVQAYADAFNEDMRVCTIIGAVAILLTFGTFSRNRLTVAERRAQQVRERFGRRKDQSTQALADSAYVLD
ncbi:hypothetical protein Daesc_003891 [Daldinia eschscholtzii]|uniref:Uncharacterized protein n=1 Tax=Daldinia eschscholtzii TaxID=292717 RepID=A0AAX6MMS9_9PEZI